LPCGDETLGVYCPGFGTTSPTPCPAGTYSNLSGLINNLQCTSVGTEFYAPTGSKYPEECPPSGFTCPGRAADEVNEPPGSKPIAVNVGYSADEDVEVISFDLDLDITPDEYDEASIIAYLAELYGINASLISVEATPIEAASPATPPSPPEARRALTLHLQDKRKLQYRGGNDSGGNATRSNRSNTTWGGGSSHDDEESNRSNTTWGGGSSHDDEESNRSNATSTGGDSYNFSAAPPECHHRGAGRRRGICSRRRPDRRRRRLVDHRWHPLWWRQLGRRLGPRPLAELS
jgi:hypothetical protein